MNTAKPLILITNDDGVSAPGPALIAVMAEIGDVLVVAPDKPQSGMGHAITTNNTLYLNKISKENDVEEYSCSGTPVDCVKLAVNEILKRNQIYAYQE
jgi:5'-nucleotidase